MVTESLRVAGLADQFEFIIDSHRIGVAKPDPAIFEAALERLDVDPSRAWYVGDPVFHDIHGALGASMARAILIDPYRLGPKAGSLGSSAATPPGPDGPRRPTSTTR